MSDYTGSLNVMGGGATPAPLPSRVTPLDDVMACIDYVIDFLLEIITFMVDNPVLCFLLAAGFVSVGITVFSKLKKVAK